MIVFIIDYLKKTYKEASSILKVKSQPSIYPELEEYNYITPSFALEAIREHDCGNFELTAQLYGNLLKDDRIFATLYTRVCATSGFQKFILHPDEQISKSVKEVFERCFTPSIYKDLFFRSIMFGFAIIEVYWVKMEDLTIEPRIQIINPCNIQYDKSKSEFKVRTKKDSTWNTTKLDSSYIVYSPNSEIDSYLYGAIRCISYLKTIREHITKFWARRAEIEGSGLTKVKFPQASSARLKQEFLNSAKNLASESFVEIPDGFDYVREAVNASSADVFQKLINRCDTGITLAILGQNMTTEINGGTQTAANVQSRVQQDRIEDDVESFTILVNNILEQYCDYNTIDIKKEYPKLWIDTNSAEDLQKFAAALQSLGQAIVPIIKSGIDVKNILSRFNLTIDKSKIDLEYYSQNDTSKTKMEDESSKEDYFEDKEED